MATMVVTDSDTLLEMMTTNGTNYLDKIGIYERTEPGGAVTRTLVDSVKSITWDADGVATTDIQFSVPADTHIDGVFLFDSTKGITSGVEITRYGFDAAYEYTNEGLLKIKSITLTI